MRGIRIFSAVLLLISTAALAKPLALERQSARYTEPSLAVGTQHLVLCRAGQAYCGRLLRPLDPSGEVSGNIEIGFEFYPPAQGMAALAGVIVATEGGPGYATTASRASYLQLFEPLMDHRALLLVDNRGTGQSAALDCPRLQIEYPYTPEALAICGQSLGGSSDLYGSGLAADDLAAVLDSLGVERVDLYGDSYGSYFAQVFSGRHPERLRSLVLDGAYQVTGLSPWYPANAATIRYAFNTVCERAAACRTLPGASLDRLTGLAERLRQRPQTGLAPDGNGDLQETVVDPSTLMFIMVNAAYSRAIYRELDAAARALLEQNDALPLLRIAAETQGDYYGPVVDSLERFLSSALFVAVSCSDYPQIYDMTASPGVRRAQRDIAVALKQQQAPGLYAPFTVEEYAAMPLDYSLLDLCLDWPAPSAAYPPGQPVPPDAVFTDAPTLVLSGELDSVTAPPSGAAAAAQFANARQVLVANSFHVTALGDLDDCASTIVRRFVSTLATGSVTCTRSIPEVRTVPSFALRYSQLAPAVAETGNRVSQDQLRAVAAAVLSAGDVLGRWWVNYDGSGAGLRGGGFDYAASGDGYRFTLQELRFVQDLAVDGTIDWNTTTGAVAAQLAIDGDSIPRANLTITWNDKQPGAAVRVTGTIGGRKVAAHMAAP